MHKMLERITHIKNVTFTTYYTWFGRMDYSGNIPLPPLLSYEEFLKRTNDLNSMKTYSQLTARCEHIGFVINKVSLSYTHVAFFYKNSALYM